MPKPGSIFSNNQPPFQRAGAAPKTDGRLSELVATEKSVSEREESAKMPRAEPLIRRIQRIVREQRRIDKTSVSIPRFGILTDPLHIFSQLPYFHIPLIIINKYSPDRKLCDLVLRKNYCPVKLICAEIFTNSL